MMDKGTYDAICLSDEEREGKRIGELYPLAVSRLVQKGGYFLITSCESSVSFNGDVHKLMRIYRQLDKERTREGIHHSRNRYVPRSSSHLPS